MKLHLPKGLRTALLAVVSLSSAYTVQAAPAAVFDYITTVQTVDTELTADDGYNKDLLLFLDNAKDQNWALRIEASNLTKRDDTDSAGVISTGGFVWSRVDDEYWEITNMDEGAFAISIAPDGDLITILADKNGEKYIVRMEDTEHWSWKKIHQMEIYLSWDAKKQQLSLLPGSIQRYEDGEIWNFKGTGENGAILLPYEVAEDWFVIPGTPNANNEVVHDYQLYVAGNPGTKTTTTLFYKGTETGWLISGETDLGDLMDGVYKDVTGDTKENRKLLANDKIQFIGANGIISTSEDRTINNFLSTAVDLKNPVGSDTASFKVTNGATLTLNPNPLMTLNGHEGEAFIKKLNILGNGTVLFKYFSDNTGVLENVAISVYDTATLEIHDDDVEKARETGIPSINLARGTFSNGASIVKSGAAHTDGFIVKTDVNGKGAHTSLKSIVVQAGDFHIEGAGSVTANHLEASEGHLTVDASINTGELRAAQSVLLTANTTVRDLLHTGDVFVRTHQAEYDDETETTIAAPSVSARIGKIDAYTVDVTTGADMTASLYAGSISAATVTLTEAGSTAVGTAKTRISLNRPATTLAAAATSTSPLQMTDALIDSTGINAASISNAAVVIAEGDNGTVTARDTVNEVSYTVGADQIITNAKATQGLSVNRSRITAGNLSADDVTLRSGQTLSASTLNADKLTAGATTATKASLNNVISLTRNAAIMQNMAAESATLAKGFSLTTSTIEVDELTVQDNVTINGATIRNSVTDLGSNVALNNVTIGDGTTLKAAALNMKQLAVSTSFGGADGQSFTVDQTIDKLVLDGSTRGNDITLTHVTLNGEELDFSGTSAGNQLEIALLTAEKGEVYFDDRPVNYSLNIQPYTRAKLTLERTATGDSLVIRGYDDEAGIKKEVSDTANRAAAMQAISEVAETGGIARTLSDYVGHVHRYALADRKEVLSAISGASTVALADSQRSGLRDLQHSLRNRVIQLGGTSPQDSEWEYNGLQAWAQADGSFSSSDASGDDAGYDFDTYGATVGVNIDVSPNTVIGASFSASYGELDVDSADKATGNNDAMYYSFFARHQNERWVQMFILTYGQNEMDMKRSVLGRTAKGDTSGTTLSAYYELGYTVGLNYEFTHILQPMVSLSLTSAKVDGYSESGTLGNAALDYDGDSYVYGTLGIGARYQGVIFQNVHDRNAVVEARALITKDFGDTTDEAQVAFAGTHKNFKVQGADTSGMGFELGAGISLPVEQNTTLFADADMTVRPDYTGFRANIGLRYDF